MAGLDDLALEGLAATDQVPDPLVLLGGNMDEDEAVVSEVPRDLDSIAAIGLAVLSGARRDQGGSGELAGEAPIGEGALKHIAGARCFIAGADGTLGTKAFEIPAELPVIVREPIDPRGLGIAVAKDGDRDGILVDIQADVESCGGHGGWSPVRCGSKPQVALALAANRDANPRKVQEASPSIVSKCHAQRRGGLPLWAEG